MTKIRIYIAPVPFPFRPARKRKQNRNADLRLPTICCCCCCCCCCCFALDIDSLAILACRRRPHGRLQASKGQKDAARNERESLAAYRYFACSSHEARRSIVGCQAVLSWWRQRHALPLTFSPTCSPSRYTILLTPRTSVSGRP